MDTTSRAKQIELSGRAVLRDLLTTTNGSQWLWGFLTDCAVFRTTFTGDALTAAFEEGRRAVGLRLLAEIIQVSPDLFIQAMREENARSATDERARSEGAGWDDEGAGDDAAADQLSDPAHPSAPNTEYDPI